MTTLPSLYVAVTYGVEGVPSSAVTRICIAGSRIAKMPVFSKSTLLSVPLLLLPAVALKTPAFVKVPLFTKLELLFVLLVPAPTTIAKSPMMLPELVNTAELLALPSPVPDFLGRPPRRCC